MLDDLPMQLLGTFRICLFDTMLVPRSTNQYYLTLLFNIASPISRSICASAKMLYKWLNEGHSYYHPIIKWAMQNCLNNHHVVHLIQILETKVEETQKYFPNMNVKRIVNDILNENLVKRTIHSLRLYDVPTITIEKLRLATKNTAFQKELTNLFTDRCSIEAAIASAQQINYKPV